MSGEHCESYDVKRETVHCYPVNSSLFTAVARNAWNLSAVFKFCFCFVLFYNKSLNDWSLGEQWILFPSNLNVSLDFVSGNIEILGKQNSLFPSGPVIKKFKLLKCEKMIAFLVFVPLAKKQRMTNELLASNDQSCVKPCGALGTMFHGRNISRSQTLWKNKKIRNSKIWMMPIKHWCLCLQFVNKVKMERITVFMRNRESAFWKKGMFFDGELRSSVRIFHGCENLGFRCCATPIIMTLMPKFATYRV